MDVHSCRTTGQLQIIIRQWLGISVFQCPQNYNYWLTNSPEHSKGELVASNCNSEGIKNTIFAQLALEKIRQWPYNALLW